MKKDSKNTGDGEVRSWDQVSINRYFELRELPDDASNLDVYGVLNGVSAEELCNEPVSTMMDKMRSLSFLKEEIVPAGRIPARIKLRGKDYTVLQDCSGFKTGQFIDYQNFVQDRTRYYTNLLTTIIIPTGHSYGEGYDPVELAGIIGEEMSITLAEGIYFFFARKSRKYMKHTLVYLRAALKANRMMMKGKKTPEGKAKAGKMKEAERELTRLNQLIDGFQL